MIKSPFSPFFDVAVESPMEAAILKKQRLDSIS